MLRPNLVVVDDIGMLPVGADAAEGFHRLVDAAYERRSVAVASNPASGRLGRAHAKDPGDGHGGPAPAPRPCRHDRGGQLLPRSGSLRQGDGATASIPWAEPVAVRGQDQSHQRAVLMTAHGKFSVAVDRPSRMESRSGRQGVRLFYLDKRA